MSFEKGTLIYVNYTAKVKDTGEAIESMVEDESKKLNIYDESRRYEPRLVAVGEDWVLRGLDEEISKMDAGQRKTPCEVPASNVPACVDTRLNTSRPPSPAFC